MVWERLARNDPLWAVLAEPEKEGNHWTIDEFFAAGTREIDASLANLAHHLPKLGRGSALDFGCGVGRLTQGLGRHYEQVIGVDIATGMIELANRHNRTPGRVSFIHNPRSDLQCFATDHFDLVFSLITLQHVPPTLIEAYVREFVRVTRPGGACYFQIPTSVPTVPQEIKRWSLYPQTMWKRLKRWTGRWLRQTTGVGDAMRMHALPEARVRAILAEVGAELVATIDHPISPGHASLIYVVRKPHRALSIPRCSPAP